MAEQRYSTYEKECLAVLLGCEKCRPYLEHKEFELQCDNLALCWLLRRAKDVGCIGRWILRLAPFKFKVIHKRGVDNVVADALSRMFEGQADENSEGCCATLWQYLPLVYSSLEQHQSEDPWCRELRDKVLSKGEGNNTFQLQRERLCYYPRGAKRRRWVVPTSLRPMVLKYFHDSIFAGHLGARKTFQKVASQFWWPKMQGEVFEYVKRCLLCQGRC
jgi:hypothetical protein